MKRKIITVALLLSMLIASAGCAASETAASESATSEAVTMAMETETARENYPDNIPVGLDFGGATIKIYGRGDSDSARELDCEQTGDIINDAIYNRNRMVEERLNVNIEAFTPFG